MWLRSGVGRSFNPAVQVAAVTSDRAEPLISEAGRFHGNAEHCVKQRVLAVSDLAAGQCGPAGTSDQHAPPVAQEWHKRDALHIPLVLVSIDECEHAPSLRMGRSALLSCEAGV